MSKKVMVDEHDVAMAGAIAIARIGNVKKLTVESRDLMYRLVAITAEILVEHYDYAQKRRKEELGDADSED